MTSEITYEILMKGMNSHQTRVDNKLRYFKGLKDGEFKIIGKYNSLEDARKVRNNFRTYQSKKDLVHNYSIKLINNQDDMKSKNDVFVVAVVCLTDADRKQKKEDMKILDKRFNRS